MGKISGQCLCGALEFRIGGKIKDTSACYCKMCRVQGGVFCSGVIDGKITFENTQTLKWYRSSDKAERGFCGTCGASLFWRALDEQETWDVNLAAIDLEINQLGKHIYTDHGTPYTTISEET